MMMGSSRPKRSEALLRAAAEGDAARVRHGQHSSTSHPPFLLL
jgi:hypothetical protein